MGSGENLRVYFHLSPFRLCDLKSLESPIMRMFLYSLKLITVTLAACLRAHNKVNRRFSWEVLRPKQLI